MQVMQIDAQAIRRSGRLDYKWILAMVVILGVFMSILDQTIVNIAIPRLQTAFGADVHSVQWVLTAYILAQGVATPNAAYFADTLGIKRLYSNICWLAIHLLYQCTYWYHCDCSLSTSHPRISS